MIFVEADVHTATPSLGNAAATWAGWAVTAVAAKFYRSQSDTAKPQRPPLTGKALSKPASLGMPARFGKTNESKGQSRPNHITNLRFEPLHRTHS